MVARVWPRLEGPADKSAFREIIEEKKLADNINALQQEHIEYLSNDPLTGLKNRGAFDAALEQELKLVHRGMKASVIAIDLDHFKMVNDTFGHSAGDEVLRQVGALIKRSVREVDIAGRVGGEELIVILSDADGKFARQKAEELREGVENLSFSSYPDLKITASFGVLELNGSPDIDEVKKLVDLELYKAKDNGRNRVEGFDNTTTNHEPIRTTEQ